MSIETHIHESTETHHLAALEYCLKQAKATSSLTKKELMILASDFEHCNTAVVTWLLNLMMSKEEL